MRNNDNLPVMLWDGESSAMYARAQIMHGEPLILEMGSDFAINLAAGACGCQVIDEGKHFLGCDPKCVLSQLAADNHLPALATVGEAAAQADLQVDLDCARSRIIIYD